MAVAIAIVGLAYACTPSPEVEQRAVVLHAPSACPVSQSDASSVFYAGGDFEPASGAPPSASVFLRDIGRTLSGLPEQTRALHVDVSDHDDVWRGLADVPSHGAIDVLVWPARSSCRLSANVEQRTSMSFGVFGRHFMIAGGRSMDGTQVPHTYVGDLASGVVQQLTFGMSTRRSRASVTEFRAPSDPPGASVALVAGGHDPDSGTSEVPYRPIATAEVYVPRIGAPGDVGDFEEAHIDLSEPRTRHGAVALATGETLLVGGRGPSGPLHTMEIVDPAKRRARTSGVALMSVARQDPTVLRLANGEILVAGGLDVRGNEVATLEWFAPDASHASKRAVDLVTGRDRAFVPLGAGGALAVVRPPEGASPDFKTVWVISADGTLEPGVPIDPSTLDTVRLFAGAEGAPALWTGRAWLRWSAWTGSFEPIADATPATTSGPSLEAIGNGDPGLALWLDDDGHALDITGFRFATRSQYDPVPKPLLVAGTEHFVPDRLASATGSAIRFEPERGLVLGSGASAFLTDVTFADFELHLDVTGNAPTVVLRPEGSPELEVGGAWCAFGQTASQRLDIVRTGRHVTVSVDGGPERACPAPLAPNTRVALGLRGSNATVTSSARNLRLYRR